MLSRRRRCGWLARLEEALEFLLFGQGVDQFHGRDEVLRFDASPQRCGEWADARPPRFLPEPRR